MKDSFGFLRYNAPITFGNISIAPAPHYAELLEWVEQAQHEDGFLYPPPEPQIGPRREMPIPEIEEGLPKRTSFLWHIPPSHIMVVETDLDQRMFRRQAGLFIVHLLAYLFNTRLQFHNWWVDSRIPTNLPGDISSPQKLVVPFLTTAYENWRGWSEEDRSAMAALLFMHSRVPGYGWPWERFVFEYMVLDALYALAAPRFDLPRRQRHGQRIERLCSIYRIPFNADVAAQLVDLRNDLFHEVSFGEAAPGFSGHRDVFGFPFRLRDLNRRLIAATLGWDSAFVHSDWSTVFVTPFDL
jgi:hypothetical protein